MKPGVITITVLVLVACAWPAAAQQTPATEKIGQVNFPISCAPAAQKPFDRAVALLRSFWYLEAVKGFTQVTQIARAEGKNDDALASMRAAAELEDSTEKHNITPGPITTARELLGDMLLEMNQPAQAAREYGASLNRAPNRFKTLYGVARASELAGDRDKARTYYTKLVAVAAASDNQRPELVQAKAFLGTR
jgi:tetratricopeptide (TPR) repeat protein